MIHRAGTEAGEQSEARRVAQARRPSSLPARMWGQPLWAHATALLVALLALLPLMSPQSSFSADEGAYALQVEALEKGSWEYDYKAAPYDPDGRHFPIYLSTRSQSGYYPYVKHPAYPRLLQAARALAGPTLGLHLLALLGTVGTAAAAWLLASELDGRFSRPSFWLAATGPALVNGFLIWAHAPSAALAGLALVGAARISRRGFTPATTATVAAALAGGALLRSEGLLFALALAAGLAWVRRRQGRAVRALASALAVALPAALAAAAENVWVSTIIGQRAQTMGVRRGDVPLLEGRLSGAWHELFGASERDVPEAALPVLLAFALVVAVGYAVLRRGSGPLSAVAGVTVVLLAIRLASHPFEPVTGLFAAWPLGLLGLVLFRRERSGPSQTASLVLVTAALFGATVLLTQYPEGGATEWGGRFLSPLLAPLAVITAAGLSRSLAATDLMDLRWATGALATLALVFAAFGLGTVGLERARIARFAEAISRHPASVTVTTQTFIPRASWKADDAVSWMQAEAGDLESLVRHLRGSGVRSVAVLVPEDTPVPMLAGAFPVVEERHEPDLAAVGLRLFVGKA